MSSSTLRVVIRVALSPCENCTLGLSLSSFKMVTVDTSYPVSSVLDPSGAVALLAPVAKLAVVA